MAIRVLYIAHNHGNLVSGGSVISDRNLKLLSDYFGKDNIVKASQHGLCTGNRDVFFGRRVQNLINQEKTDIVFLDNSLIGYFGKAFYKRNKVICFFHNVEGLYARQQYESSRSLKKAVKLRLLIAKESNNARYSDVCIAINKRDANQIEELYGRRPDCILPSSMEDKCAGRDFMVNDVYAGNDFMMNDGCTGHNLAADLYDPATDDYLLFVGIDFFGNTDGLLPFVKNCMPRINCRLIVAGTGMEKYNDCFDASCKTRFIGYTKNLSELYYGAKAVVLPIVSGSGMKTKTCEALMYGKKIFGTKEAFEGFEHLDANDCVYCDSDIDFICKINDYLIENGAVYSAANRQTFLQHYSYDAVKNEFFEFLDSLPASERLDMTVVASNSPHA